MHRPLVASTAVAAFAAAVFTLTACPEENCYVVRKCPTSTQGAGGSGGSGGSMSGPGGAGGSDGGNNGAAGGDVVWEAAYGGPLDDIATGLVALSDGSIVVGGYFSGTLDFGGGAVIGQGGTDAFVTRLDTAGEEVWMQRYGVADDEHVIAVAADAADNVYVTGDFESTISFGLGVLTSVDERDLFAARLSNGQAAWSIRMGSQYVENAGRVAAGPADSVLVAGEFQDAFAIGSSSMTGPTQRSSMFLAKLMGPNPMSAAWTRSATGGGYDEFVALIGLAVDPAGNTAFAASVAAQVRAGVTLNFDGTTEAAPGQGLTVLYRTDPSGNHSWHARFVGGPTDVSMYSNGDVLICGSYSGSGALSDGFGLPNSEQRDVWVARYSAIGVLQWARRYGGPGNDGVDGAVRCRPVFDNGYIIAAHSDDLFNAGDLAVPGTGPSVVVARFQDSGSADWARRTEGDATVVDLAATDSDAVVALNFDGTAGLETPHTATNGSLDIYLARLTL